jgi:DNA-binding NarL/FixJ family response regulator
LYEEKYVKSLRVLLVDDNERFIDSVERYLVSVPDLQIDCVGKATSGEDAIKLTPMVKPDLVLMDLTMPGINGLIAMQSIKKAPNPPRVVMLTIHDSDEYRWAAKDAGADGFLSKSELTEKLIPILRSMFTVSPQLAGGLPT